MTRKPIWLYATTAFAALFAFGAQAQERVVNVYNWSDYIDSSIIDDFTKETGIKVVYDTFDSNEILETKLLAGGTGYDVVVPTANFLARQIQAGVFQKLDKSKLPNLSNMWPEVMERLAKYDPGNEYAVNYMWGTTGIGYNVEKVKAALGDVPVDSWDILFKPENAEKLKACGINILDASDETFAIAMNYIGKNPDSKETADLEAGGEVYAKIRPNVKTFNSSAYIDELANGDSCISIGWSGDVLQAKNRAVEAKNGVNVNFVIPKEGTYMWFDNLAIPADAMVLDVGPKSIKAVNDWISKAETLVWNGPLGAFEIAPFDTATVAVAKHAAEETKAGKLVSVAGGGDTVSALNHAGVADDFTYISTAGGAFLEWMEGKDLPGVTVLQR